VQHVHKQIKSLRHVPGKGVFMEELVQMLRQVNLQPELFAITEKNN